VRISSGVGALTSVLRDFAPYFSTPGCKQFATEVEDSSQQDQGLSPEHREGRGSSEWALLDFGVYRHVFSDRPRHYYDLEAVCGGSAQS